MDTNAIAAQLRCPSGDAGKETGLRMAEMNQEANTWALSLLDVEDTDAVLEIGFGPGTALAEISKHTTGQVAGIELSPAMLAMAQERNAEAIRMGKMTLTQGDAAQLPYDDDTFDKALCVNVIYFWENPLRCLQEIHRVLKDDGFLVLSFLGEENWLPGLKESGLFRAFTAEDAEALLQEAGFTGIGIRKRDMQFGGRIGLLAMK
ncbi:MAG TPA: class I SAM-dependent methyltransferase [Candidatus Peribacteria bacterium]|nr:class I SAM-dependent methyltransferase [Candidatus Peribacteria bacterium]